MGITAGDRVAGYLPNIPQTLAAYLATAALGAIWCSVPRRWAPNRCWTASASWNRPLLIAIDGYRWGKRDLSRADDLARIRDSSRRHPGCSCPTWTRTADHSCRCRPPTDGLHPRAGRHPLRAGPVLPPAHRAVFLRNHRQAQGDRALPRRPAAGALQGHGAALRHGPEADTAFWFTTTGWMVWTMGVSTLLTGAAVVLMDGDPNWPSLDGEWSQWAVVAETGATYLGTGSAYLAACAHAGLTPGTTWDLSRLREIQCSGSPLAATSPAGCTTTSTRTCCWPPPPGAPTSARPSSGRSPLTAVYAGEMSCRPLGVSVDPGTPTAGRCTVRPGNSWPPSRCRRCPSSSGATRTRSATAAATSAPTQGSGATATGSSRPSAAPG